MRRIFWVAILVSASSISFSPPAKADEYDNLVPALDSALADSGSLDGHVVYLDFWASWCVPCRKSFPWLVQLQHKFHDQGLRVVAVNVDRDQKAAEKFLKTTDSTVSIIYDPKGAFARRLHLDVMPTSFIIDRKGVLKRTNVGFSTEDTYDIEQFVLSLLKPEEAK